MTEARVHWRMRLDEAALKGLDEDALLRVMESLVEAMGGL